MKLTIDSLPQEIAAALAEQAAEHRRSMEDEVVSILKDKLTPYKGPALAEDFRRLREEMLKKNGGKLFSDSASIIRESRDHDH